ncbi:MAG: Wzz/FepE/Etk N-terminal domain-containing protein [Peptoniphilaceae bacterium]|nr:Wzz/FepE/Etk N-terminal domain-containing protein [Peptoniphilaceae bacterium]MDD7383711.1 Wzz/FepE/Etk N-terminal domain-containing protein [Peptoniphilaceae bacterium]MDY3737890.1 Wzz/FepE/Etk N-terminal domain-containing protein [Peptoniphilaceae bacterium]
MLEKEIDLIELWEIIKKNLIKIIFIGILFAIAMFAISKFLISPKYQSYVSLIVNKEEDRSNNDGIQLNDVQLNQKLVGTYTEIIKTRGIAEIVIKNLGLDLSYEDFISMISVNSKNDTEIFEVSVKDTIPERASDIANETSKVFKDSIVKIMNVDNVQILDKAIVPEKPYSPNIIRNAVIGFLFGIMVSMFTSIIRFLTDTRIKSSEDITNEFGLPVIGIIPDKKI